MDLAEYFLKQLKSNNSDVSKDDILRVAEECGLEVKQRTAKSKIIDMIVEHGSYEKLYEYFSEFITVPYWEVADFYNMNSNQILKLNSIGVIKEQPIEKELYSRQGKSYYKANTYPISIFNYDEQKLKQAYENAYGGDMYALRLETKTKEEGLRIISLLEKIFKIDYSPASYEHRNGQGMYTYLKVKPLNGTDEEQNRFLKQISDLEGQIVQLKKENQEKINEIYVILEKYIGKVSNKIVLENKLEGLIEQLNNPVKVGRKPKFDKNKIMEMEIMKENGYSYSKIAEELNTSKVTVIKYLKHRKK